MAKRLRFRARVTRAELLKNLNECLPVADATAFAGEAALIATAMRCAATIVTIRTRREVVARHELKLRRTHRQSARYARTSANAACGFDASGRALVHFVLCATRALLCCVLATSVVCLAVFDAIRHHILLVALREFFRSTISFAPSFYKLDCWNEHVNLNWVPGGSKVGSSTTQLLARCS